MRAAAAGAVGGLVPYSFVLPILLLGVFLDGSRAIEVPLLAIPGAFLFALPLGFLLAELKRSGWENGPLLWAGVLAGVLLAGLDLAGAVAWVEGRDGLERLIGRPFSDAHFVAVMCGGAGGLAAARSVHDHVFPHEEES